MPQYMFIQEKISKIYNLKHYDNFNLVRVEENITVPPLPSETVHESYPDESVTLAGNSMKPELGCRRDN
ncbi:hypothetical protein [Anabaena sp. CCY 9402-a]|uniref:hypothetical protein n=1 Tax=Anabaena sp. CCY 9402-a TaxID=3103867 RepID=UPI0039C644F9